jgi:hypothetical protein
MGNKKLYNCLISRTISRLSYPLIVILIVSICPYVAIPKQKFVSLALLCFILILIVFIISLNLWFVFFILETLKLRCWCAENRLVIIAFESREKLFLLWLLLGFSCCCTHFWIEIEFFNVRIGSILKLFIECREPLL